MSHLVIGILAGAIFSDADFRWHPVREWTIGAADGGVSRSHENPIGHQWARPFAFASSPQSETVVSRPKPLLSDVASDDAIANAPGDWAINVQRAETLGERRQPGLVHHFVERVVGTPFVSEPVPTKV